jgi:hypothetical protein
MTSVVLSPLRKQGDVSRITTAPPAVLLQGSGTSPTATLACTQGSNTSLPDTLAHSYTPIVHLNPLLASIKGRSRAFLLGRVAQGTSKRTGSLSLSRDACNPYYEHPRCEIIQAAFPPCVPSCANPSGQGHAAINSLVGSVEGPPGSETPTVSAPGRGMLRVNEHLPVEFQMGSLQQPLQPGTLLRFGSLEFMSLDGSYDMVLLPQQRDSNNDGRQLARRRQTRRRLPPWRKSSIRVCPTTLLAAGGGDGATVARQQAAPRRLSDQSESTTPSPKRGICRALSSHLRQRRMSFPRNVPTPRGLMTPALSRRTCWVLASYLR